MYQYLHDYRWIFFISCSVIINYHKVIMEDPQNWCCQNSSFLWETASWFIGGFLKAFPRILNIFKNYCWTMSTTLAFVNICHTFCLLKFGHQTLNCPSIRYIVPPKPKILREFPLCQRNWFCGKVHVNDFYSLLRSRASIIGSILVSKETPRTAVCTTWKIWEKVIKHKFWMKSKLRRLFWTTLQ